MRLRALAHRGGTDAAGACDRDHHRCRRFLLAYDALGHVLHLDAVAAGGVPDQLERLVDGDREPLRQYALRLLDHDARAKRLLELADARVQAQELLLELVTRQDARDPRFDGHAAPPGTGSSTTMSSRVSAASFHDKPEGPSDEPAQTSAVVRADCSRQPASD